VYVLHHLVTDSCIGFTAVPTCCFESDFPMAYIEELKKLIREWQEDMACNISGASVKAIPVASSSW